MKRVTDKPVTVRSSTTRTTLSCIHRHLFALVLTVLLALSLGCTFFALQSPTNDPMRAGVRLLPTYQSYLALKEVAFRPLVTQSTAVSSEAGTETRAL